MKQKIFLTSMIAMGFVAPAMATPSNTGTFPQDGLMQEDYTYTNAATSTNMAGVYSGTVNAEAQYSDILYTIGAGKYLPAGAEAVIDCNVPGSYCPGLQSQVTYDANNNQGLTSCSTVGDGSYTLSDGTGSANTSCYKTCSASCTQPSAPAHSTNVSYGTETASGNQYYGSSCNAVAPTCSINFNCANGYHKRPDITLAQGVALYSQFLQDLGQTVPPQAFIEETIQEMFDNWENLPEAERNMINAMISDGDNLSFWSSLDSFVSTHYADSIRTNISGTNAVFYSKDMSGTELCLNGNNQTVSCDTINNATLSSFRQTAQNGDWFVQIPEAGFSSSGHSRCIDDSSSPCEKSYTMLNGQSVSAGYQEEKGDLVDGWNFYSSVHNGGTCQELCARASAENSWQYISWYRLVKTDTIPGNDQNSNNIRALGLSVGLTEISNISMNGIQLIQEPNYMCDANKITINWGNADTEDITANNAGTAIYGSDIRTPVKAQTIPGKTFTGWRFVAPQQASVQEP